MSEELTMKDLEAEINASMVRYREGDMVKGIIAGIENYVVYVDIGSYMQGIILPDQLSDDPAFSMMDDLKIGEEISAIVDREDDGSGTIVLSLKKATEIKAWEMLKDYIYYMHIKDSQKDGFIVPAGYGDGNVKAIVAEFLSRGGRDFTIEPHLTVFEGLAALEKEGEKSSIASYKYKNSNEAFDVACNTFKKLLGGI